MEGAQVFKGLWRLGSLQQEYEILKKKQEENQ